MSLADDIRAAAFSLTPTDIEDVICTVLMTDDELAMKAWPGEQYRTFMLIVAECLPNGVLFDAFGRERVRYVRVIHDGTTCVVPPGDVASLVDSERPEDYRTEDVYLSKEEFDALPEFDGF